ncbi:uncharacterized protein LOC121738149 [Aricia agestis]|uniref:uncharacterized protein LOC121738149 n=1 Tax=Aricia agestis TaxID=91739 RepID=UPI001C20A860|nr:uncharacterized protein LOC121738149 [Aricia agestis]
MLIIAVIFFSVVEAMDKCDRVQIDNSYYKRQLISIVDGTPSNIAVDSSTGNIYFILNKRNYTKGVFVIRHGALGAKKLHIYEDNTPQCIAIDDRNDKAYIGTNSGILTYDFATEMMSQRPIGDDDIRSIFIDKHTNNMYITIGSNHEVYKFLNESAAVKQFDKVPKAYNFVLDGRGNVFYEHVDGRIYFYNSDYFEAIQYKGFSKELKYIIRIDNEDKAMVTVKEYLFKLLSKCILPVKIADLEFKITGLAFDSKNDIIVGTKGKIYRFKLIDQNEPCHAEDFYMANLK